MHDDLLAREQIQLRNTGPGDMSGRQSTPQDAFDRHAPVARPGGECWLWRGPKTDKGYGVTLIGGRAGKKHAAHRLSWELACGPIPAGQCVCHRCDTPLCVNPDHLFLGTMADNMADKVSKGRQRNGVTLGESSHIAKLDMPTARDIRAQGAGGVSQRALAKKYGVTKNAINLVLQNKTWREDARRTVAVGRYSSQA